MKLVREYKTQGIYISLGLIALFFPFLPPEFFLVLFLAVGSYLSITKPGSHVFSLLARDPDIKAGKLTGLVYLFFTMAILLLISLLVGVNKFTLFIIAGALAITTFGDGVGDIINIHERAKNPEQKNGKVDSAKSSMVFLISGSLYAFIVGAWISDLTLPIPYGM